MTSEIITEIKKNKKVIGIAGTAKNAGKTTAITSILTVLRKYKKYFCITGIGYDGEDIDNITNLPKPKIFIKQGEFVATAEKCVNEDFVIIEKTNLFTPLGEIFICKALKDTMLVAVGANKIQDLKKLISLLDYEYILVDGALNRFAPMSEVDNIIISIGASQSENIEVLTETAKSIEKILSIKEFDFKKFNSLDIKKLENKNVSFFDESFNNIFESDYSSILIDYDINLIDDTIFQKSNYMYVAGIVSSKSILEILKKPYKKNNFTLLINNPISLLSSRDAITIFNTMKTLEENGIKIKTLKTVPLMAITVNPFFPKYDYRTRLYTEDYIDSSLLFESIKKEVSVPVFDIVKYGSESIERLFI